MAHDVFISHSSRDKPVADAVCAILEARGIRCWIAPRDILPGASWAESLIDAIQAAQVMVLVFSANANASAQVHREVERAVHLGLTIIPFRIEATAPTKTMEYFISTPHWLDAMAPPLDGHIERLAHGLQALLSRGEGRRPAETAPRPDGAGPPPCPGISGLRWRSPRPPGPSRSGLLLPHPPNRLPSRPRWRSSPRPGRCCLR